MINPYCFTDENLKLVFKLILNSHNINTTNSILSISLIYTVLVFFQK